MCGLLKRDRARLPGVPIAAIVFIAGVAVAISVCSCGNSAKAPPTPELVGDTPITPPAQTENSGGFGFLDPAWLMESRNIAATPDEWKRSGSEFEPLLPNNRVIPTSSTGIYLPAYIPGSGTKLDGLAYGMYIFNTSDFVGGTTVYFDWETPPTETGLCFVGVSNFEQNNWSWFQPVADAMLFLDTVEPYTSPDAGNAMLLAVAMTGGNPAVLKSIRLGEGIAPDSIYAIPEQTVVEPGEVVRVTVYARNTEHPLALASVRLLVTEGNKLVDRSFNIGAPGGKSTDLDGIWVDANTKLSLTGYEGNGLDAPAGYTALDFTIAPLDGQNITLATGALFNFELEVNHSTDLTFDRMTQGILPNRTYYSNLIEAGDQYWADDSNDGMPGIRLPGWPTAVLEVDISDGDTPLTVNFDASESWDEAPGAIVKYEFDFGEGEGYEDYGSNPLSSHVYSLHGRCPAYMKVTDNSGCYAVKAVEINAKSFDEVENNDKIEDANELPPFPFSGFRGSIGKTAGENEGTQSYDGDVSDYFALDLEPDVHYRFVAEVLGSQDIPFQMRLFRANGSTPNLLPDGWEINNTYAIEFIPDSDDSPMTLQIRGYNWGGNYLLTGMRWPPTAILKADHYSGELPLTVEFDGTHSWDAEDNDIVEYWFDLDDGAGFIDNGNNPKVTHTYTVEGLYSARIKVFDSQGNYDVELVSVYAGQEYDEIEPNHSSSQRQIHFPAVNFRGSIGSLYDYDLDEYVYLGYDGGVYDIFTFAASAGKTVHATLDSDSSTGNLDLCLLTSKFRFVARSQNFGDHEELTYTILPEDEGTMLIYIPRRSGYSDYLLNAEFQ